MKGKGNERQMGFKIQVLVDPTANLKRSGKKKEGSRRDKVPVIRSPGEPARRGRTSLDDFDPYYRRE